MHYLDSVSVQSHLTTWPFHVFYIFFSRPLSITPSCPIQLFHISYSSFPPHEFGIVCNGVGISEVILTFIFFFITFYVCFWLFLSLFQNGSLSLKRHIYSSDEYCVALSNYSIETFDLFNATFRICPKDDFSSMKHFIYTRAFPICCSISNFFLLLTFSVYALLPELRGPTFGKITMIFIVALFLAYLVICNESIWTIYHCRVWFWKVSFNHKFNEKSAKNIIYFFKKQTKVSNVLSLIVILKLSTTRNKFTYLKIEN